jgi:hypothetical protein
MPVVSFITTTTPAVPGSPSVSRAKVSSLVARVQSLVDDPSGSWADYDYIKNDINQANEDLNTELKAYNLSYGETSVVIKGVPPNSSDLSAYMDGVLASMELPTSIEWRNAGDDDAKWKPVPRVDKIKDVTNSSIVASWKWESENVLISPCMNPVDLRVCFDALTAELDDPTQEIIRGALNVLAYRTAELVAAKRGGLAGTGEPLAKYLERKGTIAADNFESLCVKRSQSIRRNFGRGQQTRSRSMTPPII